MITITPSMRLLVATEPVDFRKGIDGLCRLCRTHLGENPFSGTVFVFFNRSRKALRLLLYDGQGFWLCHKRLSQGRFRPLEGDQRVLRLAAHELQILLWNGDMRGAGCAPFWKKITPT